MKKPSAGEPWLRITVDGQHWLVKFRSSYDPKDIGTIEYEYSLAAKKCSIDMPETKLFEGKFFGVRRFDREGDIRYHVHTAGGLLYANHRLPSLSFRVMDSMVTIVRPSMEKVTPTVKICLKRPKIRGFQRNRHNCFMMKSIQTQVGFNVHLTK